MPTPNEEAVVAPLSPPIESTPLRSSCPPEERHAPRETRLEEGEHEIIIRQQMPTPEPDGQPEASTSSEDDVEKGEHIEDAATVAGAERTDQISAGGDANVERDAPSPSSSPDVPGSQNDIWTTQTVTSGIESEVEYAGPRYLQYPPIDRHPLKPYSTTSFLRPGSKFKGTQESDRQVYDVQVEIKDVDLAQSYLCGYLRIQGLTDDHPTLTTFFSSEIIGPDHAFLTTNPTLHSTPKIDLQHWSRFPAFRNYYNKTPKPSSQAANHLSSSFTLKDHLSRDHLFMRWKELFLVPDHRVRSINGASFEGFYYICFDQQVGSVSGIYFHARSEKFQQLKLDWCPDGGCGGAVEFR